MGIITRYFQRLYALVLLLNNNRILSISRAECVDDPDYRFPKMPGNKLKQCQYLTRVKKNQRLFQYCDSENADGILVKDGCPFSCRNCPQSCEDSVQKVQVTNLKGAVKDKFCDWLNRGDSEQRIDINCVDPTVSTNCPKTCAACPSDQPSSPPFGTADHVCPTNGRFEITLMNTGENFEYDEIFASAKARWESVIKCDLLDVAPSNSDWFGGFLAEGYSGPVDDVVIGYEIVPIDGLNNLLGISGSPFIRSTSSPISGVMKFDEVDFANMSMTNVEIIILHEMGHVLGLANLGHTKCYSPCSNATYGWKSGCVGASDEYSELGLNRGPLLVDLASCGHWSEKSFPKFLGSSELMTPIFEPDLAQPLSRVSIAALEEATSDYVVDYSSADPFPYITTSGKDGGSEAFKVLTPTSKFTLEGIIRLENPTILPD